MSEVAQTPHHTLANPSLSDEVHLQILSITGLAGIYTQASSDRLGLARV